MAKKLSLLELLQSLIERTYGMKTGIQDLERFIVGDRGLREIYAARTIRHQVRSKAYSQAQVLVRQEQGSLYANIYYPDSLIAELERTNPMRGLDGRNLDAFAVFVEEIDHLLTLADRAGQGRQVSLFELELHANLTKYATCRHFLERTIRQRLDRSQSAWLRWSLFEKLSPPAGPPDLRERYRDADRLADRYCAWFERLPPAVRLGELRTFHPLPASQAVRRIETLARGIH